MRATLLCLLLATGCNRAAPGKPVRASLPQAVDGALWVDPAVYATAPLRVIVDGKASAVRVTVGGAAVDAIEEDPGEWLARLAVGALPDGMSALDAEVSASGQKPVHVSATLGVGRAGVQLSDFSTVGAARSPRLHKIDGGVYATWTDRSDGKSKAWLRRLDGAGRFSGARVLLAESDDEVHYARTAVGNGAVGVLYQRSGTPYRNWFKLVALDGRELLAPIALDPPGWDGTSGGDISFDGEAFVAVWRSQGAGPTQLGWLRADATTHALTGPVVLARAGAGTAADPVGVFEPFSFVSVQAIAGVSVVGFVREHWSNLLAQATPRAELVTVQRDGTVGPLQQTGRPDDLLFYRESRVYKVASDFVAIWSAKDLNDTATNPRNVFYGARLAALPAGAGAKVVDAADDRDEPFFVAHPEKLGVLAWLDHRDWDRAGIQLYVAGVNGDLSTDAPAVFPHARFVAGTSELNAVTAGSNVLLLWSDERHGKGIADPKPELYFETAWL